jgi:hypothetical protein
MAGARDDVQTNLGVGERTSDVEHLIDRDDGIFFAGNEVHPARDASATRSSRRRAKVLARTSEPGWSGYRAAYRIATMPPKDIPNTIGRSIPNVAQNS